MSRDNNPFLWWVLCVVALIVGCTTVEQEDYGPKLTTYSKSALMDKGEITLPPGFSTSDFTHLVMAVNFKASDKLPQNVAPGEEPLPIDPTLSTRFQAEIDKMKRFTTVALHGVDTENDLATAADLSNGNLEIVSQDKPLKVNVLLQGQLTGTKSRTVVRGNGSSPDTAQVVYKVYVTAICKDLRKGTVAFSEVAVGKARPRVQTLRAGGGRPRGGFDAKEQSSRSGETMTLDKGFNDGIGVGQQCVIAVDDGGVTIPVALAEAYPEKNAPKSALKIYRWNDADKDAKAIIKDILGNPRGFMKENQNGIFAVCYGMAVPPEWEQNATK